MFEQSLLDHASTDHAGSRRTATFAASLTAQIAVTGVLLLAPLFYHDVLPALRLREMLPVVTVSPPPELPVESQPVMRSRGLALPGVFRPPVVTRSDYPQAGIIVVDLDAPAIPATSSLAPFPIGSSTLPRLDGPPAPTATKSDVVPPLANPVSIGGDVLAAKLITRVVPIYPRPAVQLRISGVVHLLGVIAKDGTIQRLQVLSGHPLLRQAALDAVSRWVYRPTFLNGQPVEVEAPIDVIFNLSR